MYMRFQRRGISWSLFVVSLTTVRFSGRNSYSFWTWFDSHINNIRVKHVYFLIIRKELRHLVCQKDKLKTAVVSMNWILSKTDAEALLLYEQKVYRNL